MKEQLVCLCLLFWTFGLVSCFVSCVLYLQGLQVYILKIAKIIINLIMIHYLWCELASKRN